ncbi:MAG: RidA family protein [Dokdonella sp.]
MTIHPIIFSISLVITIAATGAHAADPEYIRSPATKKNNLPFSDAVRVGDLVFLSGQIGSVPGSLKLADGGIEGEARQAMKNIGSALELAGSSWQHVVKCTVFLADIKDWPAFNTVYTEFFTGNLPARSALAASGLAKGAKVEVECIAAVK